MRSKQLRLSEMLEILALGLGCCLLLYFSCRDEVPIYAERGSKVFRVPRAAPATDGSGDASADRAAIEQALGELLSGIATGEVEETRRSELQASLMGLLERFNWGSAEGRATASAVIVQQMFDQAKLQSVSAELSARQRQAIRGMAKELTRQLMLMATGSSPGADGIVATLPLGHERVTWNQLGGFAYREGGPLPPEVQALDGRKVGIPGFMLTLGETEGVREFILVESLWGCCFGSVPDVNQTLVVRMKAGQSAEYTSTPIVVTGTLDVGEEREGGFVTSLYRLTDASVQPIQSEAAPSER